jgi:predicted nucleotidyltransferase
MLKNSKMPRREKKLLDRKTAFKFVVKYKERNMVYTISEITDRLTPVFEQNGVTKAILFGSYAKGTATEESDIDLAIEAESYVSGFMFGGIYGHIIQGVDKQVDLVLGIDQDSDNEIYDEILKSGVVIYER